MTKEEIKVEELDGEVVDELASGLLLDAIVDLLIKKKIIKQEDIEKQLRENQKDMEEFIEKNPSLIRELKENIKSKRESETNMGSYIG